MYTCSLIYVSVGDLLLRVCVCVCVGSLFLGACPFAPSVLCVRASHCVCVCVSVGVLIFFLSPHWSFFSLAVQLLSMCVSTISSCIGLGVPSSV
jgi:hypothetical protein